ncbi:unnamed protein product, partial [Ranitomeya imitator]
ANILRSALQFAHIIHRCPRWGSQSKFPITRSSAALAELLAAKYFNPFRWIYIVGRYRSSEVAKAADVSQMRGARVISAEDILFLMRRDKKKLKRLLKYMVFRDYKSKVLKGVDEDDLEEKMAANNNANKRQKLAQDFLNSIDQTGELLALMEDDEVDEVKQERMEVRFPFQGHKLCKIMD